MRMSEYSKYSLEQLENWIHDALCSNEISAREIYDTIYKIVNEDYHYYKNHSEKAYDLMLFLNSNGNHIEKEKSNTLFCDSTDASENCKKSWTSFWEETDQSEKEIDSICEDVKESKGYSQYYYDYTRNDINRKNPFKQNKWVLPVEQSAIDGSGDYYVTFPEDLLEAANLKEGDEINWVDNGDGSYTLKKVN